MNEGEKLGIIYLDCPLIYWKCMLPDMNVQNLGGILFYCPFNQGAARDEGSELEMTLCKIDPLIQELPEMKVTSLIDPLIQVLPEMKVQNLVQLKMFEGRRKETIDKLWNITGGHI